jgi:hypothetical protein
LNGLWHRVPQAKAKATREGLAKIIPWKSLFSGFAKPRLKPQLEAAMNITPHASAGFEPGSLLPSLLGSLKASGSGSCLVLPTEDTCAEGRLKRFFTNRGIVTGPSKKHVD